MAFPSFVWLLLRLGYWRYIFGNAIRMNKISGISYLYRQKSTITLDTCWESRAIDPFEGYGFHSIRKNSARREVGGQPKHNANTINQNFSPEGTFSVNFTRNLESFRNLLSSETQAPPDQPPVGF